MNDEPDIAALARDIRAIAERLNKEGASNCPFTADEVERIKRGAEIVQWFDTLGYLGPRILAISGSVVLFLANWERIVTSLFGGSK